jgi:hypothetical protein
VAQGLIGAAGIALFASLFLPWFEPQPDYCPPGSACPPPLDPVVLRPDVTGWEAFRTADILLALASLAAVALTVVASRLRLRLLYLGVALIGGAAIVLAMVAVERPANPGAFSVRIHVGYALALLSGGGITLGALWAGLWTDSHSP